MQQPHVPFPGAPVAPWQSRTYEQYVRMRDALMNHLCPFCTLSPADGGCIKSGDHWWAKANDWARAGQSDGVVFIARKHIETLDEVPADMASELLLLLSELNHERQWIGGGLSMRFGSLLYNSGTIRHLHAQVQIPDLSGEKAVSAMFAKDTAGLERTLQRAKGFERRYRLEHDLSLDDL